MSTPLQAIINRSGVVDQVLACTPEAAEELRPFNVYPGATWIDVTGIQPTPAPGWRYTDGQFSPPPVSPAPAPSEQPTPTTPDEPAIGSPSAEIAALQAQVTAQQESLDGLIDAVASLIAGGDAA